MTPQVRWLAHVPQHVLLCYLGPADRAERLLEGWGCPPTNLVVDVGASVGDVVSRAAERFGCDVIAVARKRRRWSTRGLSRRELQALDRATPGTVLELAGTGRAQPV
jgi:hypothetical protein